MIKKEEKKSFFELSEREQKKVIERAARAANEQQRELVKEYEKRFGKSEQPQMTCDSSQ